MQRAMIDLNYPGTELELFSEATNWKSYLRSVLEPYFGARVLEVGAGIGGTTKQFCRGTETSWICLEPDVHLAEQLAASIRQQEIPACCQVRVGTLDQMPEQDSFDTLMYIDVLEHIEDDRSELARASDFLKPGGYLLVLCPAHQYLYTPFDIAIGHFRRYSKAMLKAAAPDDLQLRRLIYLDSVGLLASLANRLILKSSMPNARQIRFWDQRMVPFSRLLDPLIGYSLGKSVLGVWQKRST